MTAQGHIGKEDEYDGDYVITGANLQFLKLAEVNEMLMQSRS